MIPLSQPEFLIAIINCIVIIIYLLKYHLLIAYQQYRAKLIEIVCTIRLFNALNCDQKGEEEEEGRGIKTEAKLN